MAPSGSRSSGNRPSASELSRRERQIMDCIYARGRATAAEVQTDLPDPPSYSAVRATLRILEEKGHLDHVQEGSTYIFRPTVPRDRASRSALKQIVQTFFDGSAEEAITALLDMESKKLGRDQIERLARLIAQAKKEGR